MKQNAMLTIASLLSIVLVTFHLADDIGHGFDRGGVSNLAVVPILVVWLYATLVFVERRAGYVINILLSLVTLGIPVIHMSGTGVGAGSRVANANGAFFFVWTLIAVAVTSLFSLMLAARGLWGLRDRFRQTHDGQERARGTELTCRLSPEAHGQSDGLSAISSSRSRIRSDGLDV